MLRRSYQKRAWIVQDLNLVRDSKVHCGRETVSRSYLHALASSACMWRKYFEGTVIHKISKHELILTQRRMSLLDILGLCPDQNVRSLATRSTDYSLSSLDSTPLRSAKMIEVDYDVDLCTFS